MEDILARGEESADVRRAQLFETYVERAFEPTIKERSISRTAMTSWLAWIAGSLSRRNRTVFMIEELQPSWLRTRGQRAAYVGGLALVMGGVLSVLILLYRQTPQKTVDPRLLFDWEAPAWILACMGWVLGLGVIEQLRGLPSAAQRATWARAAVNVVLYALPWAVGLPLVVYLQSSDPHPSNWLAPAMGFTLSAVVYGIRRSPTHEIRTMESLWIEPRAALHAAGVGLVLGAMLAAGPIMAGRRGRALRGGT